MSAALMLAEADAILLTYAYNLSLRVYTLTRIFPRTFEASIEAALALANTSVTITNPKAKGSLAGFFPGVFNLIRNARGRNDAGEQSQGIIQTLCLPVPWSALNHVAGVTATETEYVDTFYNVPASVALAFPVGYTDSAAPTPGWSGDVSTGAPSPLWVCQVGTPELNPETGAYTVRRVRRLAVERCTGTGTIGDVIGAGTWMPFESFADGTGETFTARWWNLTKAATELIRAYLLVGPNNDFSSLPNEYQRYDGGATMRTTAGRTGATGWVPESATWTTYSWQTRDDAAKPVRKLTYTAGRIVSTSKSSVSGFIGGKGGATMDPIKNGWKGSYKTLTAVGAWAATPA